MQTDRKSGGLGELSYPIVSDITKKISKSFGVLIPDQVMQRVCGRGDVLGMNLVGWDWRCGAAGRVFSGNVGSGWRVGRWGWAK